MIGQFIGMLFLARDVAHLEHLRVSGPGSFAAHMALGEFYESIIGLADKLTEAYQGRHGIIEIELLEAQQGPIIEELQRQLDWIEDNRYKAVKKEDTALQNMIDEIVGQYLSTLYKLNNLQ